MRTHAILLALFAAVALTFTTAAEANSRCPAGSSGCTPDNAASRIQQRVNQGARDVMRNNNPNGRVREVQDTLRDCFDCGAEAIRRGIEGVGDGSRGQR